MTDQKAAPSKPTEPLPAHPRPMETSSETNLVVRMDPGEAVTLMDTGIDAARKFQQAPNGRVAGPDAAWNTLEALFRTLMNAPAEQDGTAGTVPDLIVIRRSASSKDAAGDRPWTLRLLQVIPDRSVAILTLSSRGADRLHRVQVMDGLDNWAVERTADGWDVLFPGAAEGPRYTVNQAGTALNMRPEAIMEREGINFMDYQARLDPALKMELDKDSQETAAGDRSEGRLKRSADALKSAFDDLDRAEEGRRQALQQRLEKLEPAFRQTSPEKRAPSAPPPADEPAVPKACPHCGEPLIEGKPFCASCGQPVPEAPEPAVPGTCRHCHAELIPGKRFCAECGMPVGQPAPPKAPQPVAPPPPEPEPAAPEPALPGEPAVCVQCQGALQPDAEFCTHCGAQQSATTTAEKPMAPPPPEADPPPVTEVCGHCQTALEPGATFCSGCGRATAPDSADAQAHCPGCGAQTKSGAKFCTRCGQAIGSDPQPAARRANRPKATTAGGPGVMKTAMTFAPGLCVEIARFWSSYQHNPQIALRVLLPCALSLVSVGLVPRIGKWAAVIVTAISLLWILHPLFLGAPLSYMVGRGVLGGGFIYTIVRLVRTANTKT